MTDYALTSTQRRVLIDLANNTGADRLEAAEHMATLKSLEHMGYVWHDTVDEFWFVTEDGAACLRRLDAERKPFRDA